MHLIFRIFLLLLVLGFPAVFFISLRYMLGFIYSWLLLYFTPLSLSLISLFPHARTKRLRPMDWWFTGRVFPAADNGPTTLFLSAAVSTLRQTRRNTSNRRVEKEEKTNVCSLQTFDGLVRCFSFRIYRWHVDG